MNLLSLYVSAQQRYPIRPLTKTVRSMSNSSLVPERQLVFSPGLAATIGLEESILLQHLQGTNKLLRCNQISKTQACHGK